MIAADHLSEAVVSRLQQNYPALRVMRNGGETVFGLDTSRLTTDETSNLELDISFYRQNTSLPIENICSRLDNYHPRTPSQAEMLEYANRLVTLQDASRGAGLYFWGDAGIGKSHVAVGLSKLFMQTGLLPTFISADRFSFNTNLNLGSGQVWIIDDLNNGYGFSGKLFKNVMRSIHEQGGRICVTSNKSYPDLLREMFVGDGEADKMRYDDRTHGLFKILHVQGDSFRQEQAWYL